jgi:hypothetical protein
MPVCGSYFSSKPRKRAGSLAFDHHKENKMGQFTPDTVADWIGFLLVVAVLLWGAWQMLEHYLDNTPFMDEEPPRFSVHQQQNLADLLAGMEALRSPLPQPKNQTPPAGDWDELLALHGVTAQDRADILRGSKLGDEALAKSLRDASNNPNHDPYSTGMRKGEWL